MTDSRIFVTGGDLPTTEAEGMLRSVGSDLEPLTAMCRNLELRAGAEIAERLRNVGELPPGGAVVTPGGALPAAFLIHVALRSGDEPVTGSVLRRALQNGLRRASELEIQTLALPPLGTGAGNLEAETSASIMISTLREHMAEASHPAQVVIVAANAYEQGVFERELERPDMPTTPGELQ